MNAFTQKPDLSKFFKEAKHAEHAAEHGRRTNSSPTKAQKLFLHAAVQNLSNKTKKSAA